MIRITFDREFHGPEANARLTRALRISAVEILRVCQFPFPVPLTSPKERRQHERERERRRDNARFDFQVSVPRRGGGYLRSPDYRDPLARRSGGPQLAPLCTRCAR